MGCPCRHLLIRSAESIKIGESIVTALNIVSVLIFFSAMFVLRKYRTNPIFVMLGSGVLGAVFYLLL